MKLLILSAALIVGGVAQANTETAYISGYAQTALIRYTAVARAAKGLDTAIHKFLEDPNEASLSAAKAKWVEARNLYSQTEVYRFFSSPIDDVDGPEGMINAWPLDEVYIDYVKGKGGSDKGIINQPALYPVIDEALLMELNEKDGEKNISTGWHAIEFLLWGQDTSATGPGTRPFTDYVVGTGKNADRRKMYLSVISKLLAKQLGEVAAAWDPQNQNSFTASFVADPAAFQKVIQAAQFLAGEELAMERMFVAYETQAQEDEHSCFSDTTANDIYYTFLGLKNNLTDFHSGVSFVSLVEKKNQALAAEISVLLQSLEARFVAFPGPFDQAVFSDVGRAAMKSIIDDLQVLSGKIGDGLAVTQ